MPPTGAAPARAPAAPGRAPATRAPPGAPAPAATPAAAPSTASTLASQRSTYGAPDPWDEPARPRAPLGYGNPQRENEVASRRASGRGKVVLLTLVTLGAYLFFWAPRARREGKRTTAALVLGALLLLFSLASIGLYVAALLGDAVALPWQTQPELETTGAWLLVGAVLALCLAVLVAVPALIMAARVQGRGPAGPHAYA
jgi:hypothetical protein